ncbi:hypothetical protein ACFBZI_11505 [Moraxella sp. ZJ142]|uniref:hypothetical protein n=1 Tax=Moraxella marmotae TaxID=3344520 RepID=UPI0035D41841
MLEIYRFLPNDINGAVSTLQSNAERLEQKSHLFLHLSKLKVVAESGLYATDIRFNLIETEQAGAVPAGFCVQSVSLLEAQERMNRLISEAFFTNHLLKSMVFAYSKTLEIFTDRFQDVDSLKSPRHFLLLRLLDGYLRAVDEHRQVNTTNTIYSLEPNCQAISAFEKMIKGAQDLNNKQRVGQLSYYDFQNEPRPTLFLGGKVHAFSEEVQEEYCAALVSRIGLMVQQALEEASAVDDAIAAVALERTKNPLLATALLSAWVSNLENKAAHLIMSKARQVASLRERNRALYFALQALGPMVVWCRSHIRGALTSTTHNVLLHNEIYIKQCCQQLAPYQDPPLALIEEVSACFEQVKSGERKNNPYGFLVSNISLFDNEEQLPLLLKEFALIVDTYVEIEKQAESLGKNVPIIDLVKRQRLPMLHKQDGNVDYRTHRQKLRELITSNVLDEEDGGQRFHTKLAESININLG